MLPEVDDVIGAGGGWALPSAMQEVCLKVESGADHRPHVYAYIRYVRPLVAWALLALGWAGYSATSPIYSFYPIAIQRASFRVAFWRNLAGLGPFLALFLWQSACHGMSAEHRAFLRDRGNWPLLLMGSMGSFWASTTTLMALAYTPNFCLVAVLSSMHPYLILLLDGPKGRPLTWTSLAVLAGGLGGAGCMVAADRLQSLLSLALCAVSSAFLVMYVKSNYRLQALVPFPCLMSINFGLGALVGLLCTLAFEGTVLVGGPESLTWALEDRRTLWLTLALSLSYTCGVASFVACGKHIPVLVIGVALAMEPESSALFEVLGGGTQTPTGLLLLGMCLITATKLWLALVSYLDRRREVVVDVTEAVEAAAACFSDIPAKH